MKNFFVCIGHFFLAIWNFVTNVVREITTILREGDKNSSFSSRRLFAAVFVLAFIYTIDIAMRKFTDLLQYGWIAALIFIPSVLCGVFAIIFSYFASITDFKTAIDSVGKVINAEFTHTVTEGESIQAPGVVGDLPTGTVIGGSVSQR